MIAARLYVLAPVAMVAMALTATAQTELRNPIAQSFRTQTPRVITVSALFQEESPAAAANEVVEPPAGEVSNSEEKGEEARSASDIAVPEADKPPAAEKQDTETGEKPAESASDVAVPEEDKPPAAEEQDTETGENAAESASDVPAPEMPDEPELPPADGCCWVDCCDCCCPTWRAHFDYVHMWRSDPSNVPLLRPVDPTQGNVAAGPPVHTAADFDFEGRSGIDTGFFYGLGCSRGVEIRYLWIDDFSDGVALAPTHPRNETVPPTAFFRGTVPVVSGYQSEVQSVELLGRHCLAKLDFTYGFRYVELNETLSIATAPTPLNYASETAFGADNDLYGLQLGLAGKLWDNCRGLRVDAITKLGIYYNDACADARFLVDDPPQQPPFQTRDGRGRDSTGDAAFLLEVAAMATYDVTCNLSVRAGYQLLLIDGVALAADQVPSTGTLFGNDNAPVNAHCGNSVLYHGLHLGLVYRM
jgi:hypothetical protein